MQGPLVDIVLLLLLVLFFGLQQRSRPQLHFRFWFVGWILILLSYLVWEKPVSEPSLVVIQNAVRVDLTIAGLLAFALSFRVREQRLKQTLRLGVAIAVPAMAATDFQICYGNSNVALKSILMTLLILGHAMAVLTAHLELPKFWRWRRRIVLTVCVLSGTLLCLAVLLRWNLDLSDAVQAELCVCASVLYAVRFGRRSLAGVAGTLGFVGWGAFYLLPNLLASHHVFVLQLFELWSVPKYIVAFAMTLNVFENEAMEKMRLVAKYRTLYEDFRVMYEAHPYPMWIYEYDTGKIRSANLAATVDYGYTLDEFLQMRVKDLEVLQDAESARVDSLVPGPADGERARFRRKNGSVVWVNRVDHSVQFQGEDARLLTARDVTERLKINQELAWKAQHDELTGLPNRLLLQGRIQQAMEQCLRFGNKAALLTIDIDHFKRVNDTYGHLVGDECLKATAAKLRAKMRQIDTLARTGGEEFTGIIGGLRSAADAERVTTTLLRVFQEPLLLDGLELPVSVSIGVAIFPDDAEDAETLRKMSDDALYHAKRTGRNRIVFAAAGTQERKIVI